MAGEVKEIPVVKLKPHPQNDSIYGQEDVSDLVALIEARGKIIDPILIKDDYTIISGHRRWKAAQELGYTTVPCEFVSYDNEEEELVDLILYNADREKTLAQKAREGMALVDALASEAFVRRLAGLKQNQTDMDESSTTDDSDSEPDKGLTRDKVAEAVGLRSGRTFDRMKDVIHKADTLKSEGNTDDAELLIAVLNRSPSAAHDLLKVDIDSLSGDDREKIKTGKIAPRAFLTKSETVKTSKKKSTRFENIKNEMEAIISTIQKLSKSASRVTDADEHSEIRDCMGDIFQCLGKMPYYDEYDYYEEIGSVFYSAVSSLTKVMPDLLDEDGLMMCKESVEGKIEVLQGLLEAIETGLNQNKD